MVQEKSWWDREMRKSQQSDYDEKFTKQIKLKLNKRTDKDILDWLNQKKETSSMQGEIKRLIRQQIALESDVK